MKKILLYLSTEKHASAFDITVAHDSGVDVVLPYDNVEVDEVADIIYHSLFPRGPRELKNTAVFIGGHHIIKAEEYLKKTLETLDRLPMGMRVSVALDPDGAYTTASACVRNIKEHIRVDGANAVVLAGTGPVGQSVAALLAREKCRVTLTSRHKKRAEETTKHLSERYHVNVKAAEVGSALQLEEVINNAQIVVAAGPEGVQLLPEDLWSRMEEIRVLADLNSVSPYGISGVDEIDKVVKKHGKTVIGSIHTGNHKMRIHQEIIKQIFRDTDQVFDLYKTYELA
ncbi:MAG: methylene-tetrahydromethanopterin dehydrogenase N-terminal domain-containing protein [Candidatus Altiarchaeota archaeon]|nr:methylene-tetrahydromethanopterin dehydrogenase N-terminal domain-containing protein [Candidatus Altiarchaeota archaeon]